MALSDTRNPILDYATANPIPAYVPPTIAPTTANLLTNESSVTIQTDASVDLEIDY